MWNQIVSKLISLTSARAERRKLTNERALFKQNNFYPSISIITPTYNRGKLLIERAALSVESQTYPNWEWIIIGDHCEDDSEARINALNDKRIIFYNLPKHSTGYPQTSEGRWMCGPIGPLNYALKHFVRGDFISNIDDDDVWEYSHLEDCIKVFEDNPSIEFISAWNKETREGKETIIKDDPRLPLIGARASWVYRSYLKFFRYNLQCWRKQYERVNDLDLVDRMRKAGVKMYQIPAVHSYTIPRPKERQIGLKAYQIAEKEGRKQYYGSL